MNRGGRNKLPLQLEPVVGMRCPCRKKSETKAYGECCEPFHSGRRAPQTAEALMRSRYSAFALGNADYLLTTWHPSTRPMRLELPADQEWLLLRILFSQTEGDEAWVEFQARSRLGGRQSILHERSRFVREAGRWLYVDGEIR